MVPYYLLPQNIHWKQITYNSDTNKYSTSTTPRAPSDGAQTQNASTAA